MEILLTILATVLLFLGLPIVILVIRDKIRRFRFRESKEVEDARTAFWNGRLTSPQFDEVEAVCDGRVPRSLVQLFADKALVRSSRLKIYPRGLEAQDDFWMIVEFVPMDAQGQAGTVDLTVGNWGKGCCFAADGMGNFYWVPVAEDRKDDAPVYFACHDPWGNTKVADSLTEFLSWPRVQKQQKTRR